MMEASDAMATVEGARPLRVAEVTWLLSRQGGGIPPALSGLAGGLPGLGAVTGVFGVDDPSGPPLAELSRHSDLRLATARPIGPRAFGFTLDQARQIRDFAPDVLHLHGLFTWPSAVTAAWARRTGRPTVVSSHGMLEPWALGRSRVKKWVFTRMVERANLRRARCLHALCDAEGGRLARMMPGKPVAVIPNGVEPWEGEPAVGDVARAKASWGLAPGERALLFIGRIHPKKGLSLLVRALAALRERREAHGWRLIVCGPDQLGHRRELEELAVDLGVQPLVAFSGPVYGGDKRTALAAAHAFVLTSHSEGLPMAALEAMAAGLPVLLTDECHLDAAGSGAGIVCRPEEGDVRRGLERLLLAGDDRRREMGANGREMVKRRFAWPRVAAQHLEVYSWLAGRRQRPECVSIGGDDG